MTVSGLLICACSLLAPAGSAGASDGLSVFNSDAYVESIGFDAQLRRLERATPAEREAAIVALALDRRVEALPWIISLARGDAFAASWLDAPIRDVDRAAGRLALGVLGGLAAERELTRLLENSPAESVVARAGTLLGLLVLGEGPARGGFSPLTRRALARADHKSRKGSGLGVLVASALKPGEFSSGLGDEQNARRRDAGAKDRFAASLVAVRGKALQPSPAIAAPTQTLLASLARRFPETRRAIRALGAALQENSARTQVWARDCR